MGGAEKSMLRMLSFLRQENKNDICVIFFKGIIEEFSLALDQIGVKTICVNNLIDLYRSIRNLNPDVVYLFARIYSFFWAIIAKIANVPVIVVAERGSGNSKIDFISAKINNTIVDGFISNSKAAAFNLRKAGIESEKIFTVYNGIEDNSVFQKEITPNNINFRYPSIVCVANIHPIKGIIYLIQAISLLRSRYPHIKAIIVGKDYSKGKFFKELDDLGLSTCYEWVGFKKDVSSYIQHFDIFVLPSLSEGMPTSILEAMSLGIPVVASDVGGIPELIQDNVSGFLFKPGDYVDLARKIIIILESKELRQRIITKAKIQVKERHSVTQMADQHLSIFYDLYQKKICDR